MVPRPPQKQRLAPVSLLILINKPPLCAKLYTKYHCVTAMRYHFTPVRIVVIKKPAVTSIGEDVEKVAHLYITSGNVKWYNHYGKWFGGGSSKK